MVDEAVMNDVFHALAHDARRAMLARLASGDLTVGQLAEPFPMSLEAASKHVRVLERAGLVRRTVEGRRHICSLSPAPLASAYSWLAFYERFWNARLAALARLFAPGPKKQGRTR
jgi:DNA-binding transcriptional ArsR family regulator